MTFTKEDKRDLLKLADIIEKKEFFNERDEDNYLVETLPEAKRDGSQFNLQDWFFNCGMPACAAAHAVCEFPERFGYTGYVREKREDKDGIRICVDHDDFAEAFNLDIDDSLAITNKDQYPESCENPEPEEVADRIRMIVKRQNNTKE